MEKIIAGKAKAESHLKKQELLFPILKITLFFDEIRYKEKEIRNPEAPFKITYDKIWLSIDTHFCIFLLVFLVSL